MTLENLIDLRGRVNRGEPVPPEELRAAISFLREDRRNAAPKKKGKDAGPVLDSAALSNLLNLEM